MQLISFNQYKNTKPKGKLNRKKVAIIITIVVVIIILAILTSIYMLNKTFRDNVDRYIFRKNIEENNGPVIELPSQIESDNILVYNNYIGILNKSILSVYSTNGKKEKELEVEISNCIYDTENRFLALAENEGSKLELISGTDILWKKDIEGNIEHIFVNKNGYVSIVVTGTSHNNVIITYNPEGTELFRTFLSQTTAIDVAISNDNKYLAYGEVDTSGSFIQSNVKIISIEKAQSDPSNSVEYIYPAESKEIIIELKYQDNNKLICMYDDSVHIIENNSDKKLLDISDTKNTFSDINLKDSAVCITEKSAGLFANIDVEITNISSGKNNIYNIDGVATSLNAVGDVIAVNLGTEVDFINTSGWLIKRYNSSTEIKDIILGEGIAGIVYTDKIEIVNL